MKMKSGTDSSCSKPSDFCIESLPWPQRRSAAPAATKPMAPKTRCPVSSITISDENMRSVMSS